MLKRIAITGPECTGKTWLAKKLASRYNTKWVPEYAVEYLQQKGSGYNQNDILNIAKEQLSRENKLAQEVDQLLFCDTDLIVNKIWSRFVYGEVPGWIENEIKNHKYYLYLLCSPDIDWKSGPFRENPKDRERLFEAYERELKNYGFPYRIVSGKGEQRFKNAVNFVDEII